jgi:hypothetical protein
MATVATSENAIRIECDVFIFVSGSLAFGSRADHFQVGLGAVLPCFAGPVSRCAAFAAPVPMVISASL